MSRIIGDGTAELEETPPPELPCPPGYRGKNMRTTIIEGDTRAYQRLANEKISQICTEKVQQGFEAYLRDLPRLLKAGREGHMVAYCGDVQAGIAPTGRKLRRNLGKGGFARREGELFVTRVTTLDADEFGVDILECHDKQ